MGDTKKVLIRPPNWVGDAVLSTAFLPLIQKNLPSYQLHILCHERVRDVFLNHPLINSLKVIPEKMSEKIHLLQTLRKERIEKGILFTNSFSSAFLFFLAGIKERIGYATQGRRILLTHPIPLPSHWDKLHQIDYYAHLFQRLGWVGEERKPSLYLTPEEVERTKRKFSLKDKNWIGICPGSAYGESKRWLPEYFRELVKKIIHSLSYGVMVLGREEERKIGEFILENHPRQRALNLCGKTTLREAIALLSLTQVVVTNDSGLMHIASTLGIPTVAIFGPTPVEKTAPRQGKVKVLKKDVPCSPCKFRDCPLDHRCMKEISPEEVWRAVKEFLGNYRSK